MAALVIGLAGMAPPESHAQPLRLERIVERPAAEGEAPAGSPAQTLAADGTAVTWQDQVWLAEGVARFRLVSPDPAVLAALQFVPGPGPGESQLRVLLFARPEGREQRIPADSARLREGRREPVGPLRPADGVETELDDGVARVSRIVVQDDHQAELRLLREGDVISLEIVPPEHGGHPSGGARPWFSGRPLTFLDYDLLGGGYTDNGIGELWMLGFLALRVNAFVSGSGTVYLGRLLLRTQAWRSESQSLWVEGGGALHDNTAAGDDENNDGVEDSATVTWTAGLGYHFRVGDWGAAAYAATVNGPLAMELYGGWQVFDAVGAFLYYHSFDGSTGYGLGLGIGF